MYILTFEFYFPENRLDLVISMHNVTTATTNVFNMFQARIQNSIYRTTKFAFMTSRNCSLFLNTRLICWTGYTWV